MSFRNKVGRVQVDGFRVQGCGGGGFAANIWGDARRRYLVTPVTSHQSPVTHRLHPPGVFCQLKKSRETLIQSLFDLTLAFSCKARNNPTRIASYLRRVMTKRCMKMHVKSDSAIESAFPKNRQCTCRLFEEGAGVAHGACCPLTACERGRAGSVGSRVQGFKGVVIRSAANIKEAMPKGLLITGFPFEIFLSSTDKPQTKKISRFARNDSMRESPVPSH